jgi:hypothetical protein
MSNNPPNPDHQGYQEEYEAGHRNHCGEGTLKERQGTMLVPMECAWAWEQ